MLILPERNEFNPGFNHDLVDRYGISVSQMTTDTNTSRSFPHSRLITGFITNRYGIYVSQMTTDMFHLS